MTDERKGDDAMGNPAVFSVASKCFSHMDEAAFAELTAPDVWKGFIDDLCVAIAPRSLYELLSEREVEALKNPPSYGEYDGFCRRHFTGGLPASAMPVESLYRADEVAGRTERGRYGADSARYMEKLIVSLGLTLPPSYKAWPDHLALELDMLAVLQRSGCAEEARSFLSERFGWLADYRQRLLRLDDPHAAFFIALVDVLIDAVASEEADGSSEEGQDRGCDGLPA
ncbi:MAG: molecular chaperone TorD family protein [Slackia sp.]|nr:molecular chaperone TorD family protein [Slackia sp.]